MKKQKNKAQDGVSGVRKALDKHQDKLKNRLVKLDRRVNEAVEDREQIVEATAALQTDIQAVIGRVAGLEDAGQETVAQLRELERRTQQLAARAEGLQSEQAALEQVVRDVLGVSADVVARMEVVESAVVATADAGEVEIDTQADRVAALAEEIHERAADLEERLGHIEIDLENTRIASMAASVAQPLHPPRELQEGNGQSRGKVLAFRKEDGASSQPSPEAADDARRLLSVLEARTRALEELTGSLDATVTALATEGAELITRAGDFEHWEESYNARAQSQQGAIDDLLNRAHDLEQLAAELGGNDDALVNGLDGLALRLDQVEADYGELRQSRARVVESLQDQDDALYARASAVDTAVQELRAELNGLRTAYANLERIAPGEVDRLTAQLGDQESAVGELRSRMAEVAEASTGAGKAQAEEVRQLRAAGESLVARADALESGLSGLRGEHAELAQIVQAEFDRLTTAQDALIAQADEQGRTLGELAAAQTEFLARTVALEAGTARIQGLQDEMAAEARVLADVTEALGEAREAGTARTEELEARLDELRGRQEETVADLLGLADSSKSLELGVAELDRRAGELESSSREANGQLKDLNSSREEQDSRLLEMVRTQRSLGREKTELAGSQKKLVAGTGIAMLLLVLAGVFIYWDGLQRDGRLQQAVAALQPAAVEQEMALQGARITTLSERLNQLGTPAPAPRAEAAVVENLQAAIEGLNAQMVEARQQIDQMALQQDASTRRLAEIAGAVEDALAEPKAGVAPPTTPARVAQVVTPPMLAQGPGRYTIQLIGAYNREAATDLARRHVDLQPLFQHQGQYQGRAWHVLLYGRYATWSEARQALKVLPEDMRAFGPWIRSLSGLGEGAAPAP